MKWYEGTIVDAVQASRTQNALFVVYIEGANDMSKKFTETINSDDISNVLQSNKFVCVKVQADSESYKQFVQIYKLVPVPSVFFIDENGLPLEIIVKDLSKEELSEKITSMLAKRSQIQTEPSENPSSSTSTLNASGETSDAKTNEKKEEFIEKDSNESSEKDEKFEKVCENGVCKLVPIPSKSAETPENSEKVNADKVAKAQELMERKRKEREAEEREKEQQRERDRRQMGQDVMKAKKKAQEAELANFYMERKKEKEEERRARERILAQIEQDKKDRDAKLNVASTSASESASSTLKSSNAHKLSPPAYDTARLQFRLSDGSTYTNDFPSTTPMYEVRTYVQQSLNLPSQRFNLATTFPRRQFNHDDNDINSQTLAALELTPNAVLLVLPLASTQVIPAYSNVSGTLVALFWSMVTPIVHAFDYMVGWFNGTNNNRSDDGAVGGKRSSSTSPRTQGAPVPKRRSTPGDSTSVVRARGNVHRLTDRHSDSEDDNSTWNGNSTQQM